MKRKIKRRAPLKIDRDFLRRFRRRLQSSFDEIGEEMGLELMAKSMTFSDYDFTGRFEASIKGKMSKEERHYLERAAHFNLPTLNSRIVLNGNPYIVSGWNTRARKRPIILERNGKKFTATILQITERKTK